MTPSPTISNIMQSMGAFLTAVMPAGVGVIQGQPNRVAESTAARFIIMSQPRFERLETNVDSSTDAVFTGSIVGTALTITAVDPRFPNAQLAPGSIIFGPSVAPGTTITAGTGQIGGYTVNIAQTAAAQTISAGQTTITMATKVTIDLDFHATDGTSGDLANVVSTLLRDPFGVNQFANQSPNFGTVPLYADDAVQRPFFNDQQQVEFRWVVQALLQANITVTVPQQFADSASLNLISLFEEFPT